MEAKKQYHFETYIVGHGAFTLIHTGGGEYEATTQQ